LSVPRGHACQLGVSPGRRRLDNCQSEFSYIVYGCAAPSQRGSACWISGSDDDLGSVSFSVAPRPGHLREWLEAVCSAAPANPADGDARSRGNREFYLTKTAAAGTSLLRRPRHGALRLRIDIRAAGDIGMAQ